MNQYLIRYKLHTHVYMGKGFTSKWKLVFVNAISEVEALQKLKKKKEYSEEGGDIRYLTEHEFIETIN